MVANHIPVSLLYNRNTDTERKVVELSRSDSGLIQLQLNVRHVRGGGIRYLFVDEDDIVAVVTTSLVAQPCDPENVDPSHTAQITHATGRPYHGQKKDAELASEVRELFERLKDNTKLSDADADLIEAMMIRVTKNIPMEQDGARDRAPPQQR